MHLVQLLLPLYDNRGRPQPPIHFTAVRAELTERFGGLTTYTRAPAHGLWQDGDGPVRDELVVYEVMAAQLDRRWWAAYRTVLERRFQQTQLVIRALAVQLL